MSCPTDALWELSLGTLEPAERAQVARHVGECPACATQLRDAEEAVAMVGLDLPPETPSPALLDRLLQSTQGHYEGLVQKLVKMWDLSADKVRELFEWMKTASWEPSGIPGVDVLHITPGPLASHADAGFVRFVSGLEFPFHEHIGDETQLILEGEMIDEAGIAYRVGDAMFKAVGTTHSFIIGKDGCVIALSLVGGVVINGVKYAVKN
jgi:anti-sigma factor ChrR (cupin superfamily)